jgi:hypothetical protein
VLRMKSITLLDFKKRVCRLHLLITLRLHCHSASPHSLKLTAQRAGTFLSIKLVVQGKKMMQVKYRSGRAATGPSFPSSGGAVKISISPFQTLTHALAEMYGLVLSSGKVHASFNRTQKRLWAHAEKFSSFYFYTPEEHLYWERVHLTSSLLSRSRCK